VLLTTYPLISTLYDVRTMTKLPNEAFIRKYTRR